MTEPVTWTTLDWALLDRLRDQFLSGRPLAGDYWRSPADLANYDFTFGRRIGWKWDAVLSELRQRGWTPPSGLLVDWGCGSGVAGRQVLDFLGAARPSALLLSDHSSLAMEFAARAAAARFPGVLVEKCAPDALANLASLGTVLISHVLNELDATGKQALRLTLARAAAVIWLEPGTYADSRALIEFRESLRQEFHVIAPCTHQNACGLLTSLNERHWCHSFAAPPAGIMGDSNWVRFAQRAGIDLRSLPYSFLVLERKGLRTPVPGLPEPGWARVLGHPRIYKGYARLLACDQTGVQDYELQKRVDPTKFKLFKGGEAGCLWRFRCEAARITHLTALDEAASND